jgi:hypothetical protein
MAAVLATLYMLLKPKGFEQVYQPFGLLVIVGIAAAAIVSAMKQNNPAKRKGLPLAIAGIIVVVMGVAWVVIANSFNLHAVATTIPFIVFVVVGMSMIGYRVYIWLSQER